MLKHRLHRLKDRHFRKKLAEIITLDNITLYRPEKRLKVETPPVSRHQGKGGDNGKGFNTGKNISVLL